MKSTKFNPEMNQILKRAGKDFKAALITDLNEL